METITNDRKKAVIDQACKALMELCHIAIDRGMDNYQCGPFELMAISLGFMHDSFQREMAADILRNANPAKNQEQASQPRPACKIVPFGQTIH